MKHPGILPRVLRGITTLLLVALVLLCAAPAMAAPTPGTGGWYWPTATEDFHGWSGWWDFRGYCWHLAQDMHSPAGKPVYAVGDGTVLESKYVRGYGPGGGLGGAVVILHKTYDGVEFKALYGHLANLKYGRGDTVKAGAVIGTINNSSPNHLHFGIHPGKKYPSDNNPYRGHTYTKSNTYGFVDPVAYLRSHYRIDPYKAPTVATVASVHTTSTALWARACSGRLFWAEAAESGPQTWTCSLPNGTAACVEPSQTVPVHDSTRYFLTVVKTEPAIVVKDKMPRLSLRASDRTPARGKAVTLSGSVKNSAAKPFVHARVRIERWDGSKWTYVTSSYTSTTGTWSLKYTPPGRAILRARFIPPNTYSTGVSASLRLAVSTRSSLPW